MLQEIERRPTQPLFVACSSISEPVRIQKQKVRYLVTVRRNSVCAAKKLTDKPRSKSPWVKSYVVFSVNNLSNNIFGRLNWLGKVLLFIEVTWSRWFLGGAERVRRPEANILFSCEHCFLLIVTAPTPRRFYCRYRLRRCRHGDDLLVRTN